MFGGAYVVDGYALVFKGFFLVAAYLTILISIDYIEEGDFYKGEYYFLALTAVFGAMVMASSRDLITMFVALETVSIPTYVLAAYNKHDRKSNEAGIKYYLIGVLSSAVMLYGMSFIFGMSGSTLLTDIAAFVRQDGLPPLLSVAIFFSVVGFAFKISAVPFHFWAPDTYEGAPLPVTAFLSVASKAAGFVAIMTIVLVGFFGQSQVWQPLLWVLAVATMFIGNLTALRQTNLVRMLAYSSIAQGGFMLAPLAVAGESISARQSAIEAMVIYLCIYLVMNLGAFACIIAIARKTGSTEIDSYTGLFRTSPAIATVFSLLLFSLAGIPPLAGWFAKFAMFRALLDAGTTAAVVLAVIAAVNAVIGFVYYSKVVRLMFFEDPAEAQADSGPMHVPFALSAAIGITVVLTLVIGVYPNIVAKLGEAAEFASTLPLN
jgi:NADH-quinone oxidoreductase subunit N